MNIFKRYQKQVIHKYITCFMLEIRIMKLYCGTNFLMIALTILPFSSNKLW